MAKKKLKELIPSQVRITQKVSYEIVYVDEFPNDIKQVGECRLENKQIVIKNNLSDTETYKTFLHELFHSISFEYPGLNLTENQVMKLEEAFYRYQRLNKLI